MKTTFNSPQSGFWVEFGRYVVAAQASEMRSTNMFNQAMMADGR